MAEMIAAALRRTTLGKSRVIRSLAAIIAGIVAVLVLAVSAPSARADVELTPYGGTTDIRPGAHGDLTVGATFTYSDANEDLRRVVVDTPAGGVGNPNAVPYENRCTRSTFETGVCPPASQIGEVQLDVTAMVGVTPVPLSLTGTISIIQTDSEVPTTVGAYIVPPIGVAVRSYATFYPVTSGPDGDMRIRSVTSDMPRTTDAGIFGVLPIRIDRYEQKLFGYLSNGAPFITNPTRCDTWMSYGYAQAYDSNANADADPLMAGSNAFRKSAEVPTTPDCSTQAPFQILASASITDGGRGNSPTLSTTLEIPGLDFGDQSPDTPRTVVATLPKSINVDVLQLGRLCSATDVAADSCPASTRVGTASVETPLIKAGLQGDAFLTDPVPGNPLPTIVIFVRGAINFVVRSSNRYVNGSQMQSTFDNLPQPGFTKFTLNITGGKDGLLKNLSCPADGSTPIDGPMTMAITGWSGQASSTDVKFHFGGCYGILTFRRTRCAKRYLNVRPTYRSASEIAKVRLYINGRKVATKTRMPFKFKIPMRNFKKGRKHLMLRLFYKDGTVVRRRTVFRRC